MDRRLLIVLSVAAVTGCTPAAVPPSAAPPAPTTVERPCGTVSSVDANGQPLAPGWAFVAEVHAAACAGDYDGVAAHMTDFPGGISVPEIVAQWRETESRTHYLRRLAETLEVAPQATQGGLTYCSPAGPVAVFSRGTHDMPATLSDFVLSRADTVIPTPECDQ